MNVPRNQNRPTRGGRGGPGKWWLLPVIGLLAGSTLAQDLQNLNAEPIAAKEGKLTFHFDTSTEGWQSLDTDSTVGLEKKATGVKAGGGALRFAYTLRRGALCILGRGGLSVKGAKSLSLWIKASKPTIFALACLEEDGSNYVTMFRAPADHWQQLRCDLSELTLSDDSTDENGRLDVDQIRTLLLTDLDTLVVQKTAVTKPSRTVWVDEVSFSPQEVHPAPTGGKAVVEGFETLDARWGILRLVGKNNFQLDAQGSLNVTHDPKQVKVGKGALEYRYPLAGKGATALMGAISLRLKNARSVSLWMKTSRPALIGMMLSERDGSRYMAPIFTPGNQWTQVKLNLSEFNLDDDSQDENGHLDGDQVNSVGFIDIQAMFGGAGAKPGETQTLWLDEFTASEKALPPRHPVREVKGGKLVIVDEFETGTPSWLGITLTGLGAGKPQIVLAKDTVIRRTQKEVKDGKGALEASYFAPEASLVALLRFWSGLKLAGATELRFALKSKYDAKLMISVEERDGSGYNKQLDVAGGEQWNNYRLALDEFTLGDDKVDENGKLDPDQLKQMSIIDLSGAVGEPGENVLWLDDVAFFIPAAKQ